MSQNNQTANLIQYISSGELVFENDVEPLVKKLFEMTNSSCIHNKEALLVIEIDSSNPRVSPKECIALIIERKKLFLNRINFYAQTAITTTTIHNCDAAISIAIKACK